MEFEEEVMPVSPSGQYLNSSGLSLTLFAVLEFQVPVHDLPASLINDVFLPISPRFSSIMVGENGGKKWKRVEVNLKDHFYVPKFPEGLSPEEYDEYFYDYLSKIAMEQLPQSRPLWEIHKINYPTSNAAGSVIFKLHHALGDGYSLMGALLSCLQRADNPSLPLTFPSRQSNLNPQKKHDDILFFRTVCQISSKIMTSVLDFGRSIFRSTVVEDDHTPIRSVAHEGVEFRQMAVTTIAFSLDHIKQITANLKVTINDVMTGAILLGVRLYMEGEYKRSGSANSTALVLLNTRDIGGYNSVSEMVKPKAAMPWGNRFAFLHLSIPKFSTSDCSDPLHFVFKSHETIKRLRNNYAAVFTGIFLEICRKIKGPEATAKYVHSTLKNSSLTMSNMIGPMEQVALANHPINGIYFTASGLPQSLIVTMLSYVGTLRATIAAEKGFIDPQKMKSCIQNAYDMIFKAAVH